jgi:hypothetical protein
MSVMTTSMRDAMRDATAPVDVDPPERGPDKLDEVISSAVDKIMARQEEPPKIERKPVESLEEYEADRQARRMSVDKHVEAASAKIEHRKESEETTEQTSDARRELRERYPHADLGNIIGGFARYHEWFKHDPVKAADLLAQSYLKMPVNVAMRGQAKPATDDAELSSGRKLDRILEATISDVIDGRGSEATHAKRDAALLAGHGHVLDAMFPGMSRADQIKAAVELDRELARDPIGVAGRIGASMGAPATPMQVRQENVIAETEGALVQLEQAGRVPNAQVLQQDIMAIYSHPSFERTGNVAADFVAAHDFATQLATDGRSAAYELAIHEFNAIGASTDEKGNPKYPYWGEVSREVIQLVANDKARDWDTAYRMATKSKIEKAQRAAPIKHSGGGFRGAASSQPHGLDGHLSAALAGAE